MQSERIDSVQNLAPRAIGRDMSGGGRRGHAFDDAMRKQKGEASEEEAAGASDQDHDDSRSSTPLATEDVVQLSDAARQSLGPSMPPTVGHKSTAEDSRKQDGEHRVDIIA